MQGEVEQQLLLLQELALEWIYEKSTPNGTFLLLYATILKFQSFVCFVLSNDEFRRSMLPVS